MLPRTLVDGLTRVVGAQLGGRLDRAFIRLSFNPPSATAPPAEKRARATARMEEAASFYAAADDEGRLFPEPPPADLNERRRVRGLPGGEVVEVRWSSGYAPLHPAHEQFLGEQPNNATVHVRWFRHDSGARATVIALHGWGMGWFALDEGAFRSRWLFDRGLDVVLMVQPFHGPRGPARRGLMPGTPPFPTANPMRTIEGFAQSVRDVRSLAAALRDDGARRVGVVGMSLGGFTTGLLATIEPRLDFLVPLLPFADVAEFMWDHGPARSPAPPMVEREVFERGLAVLDPMSREPLVDGRRMLVIAAEHDHVTPARYARRLQARFAGSRLVTTPGSHVLQVGRGPAFEALAELAVG